MKNLPHNFVKAALIGTTLTLSACGGSGSTSTPAPIDPQPTTEPTAPEETATKTIGPLGTGTSAEPQTVYFDLALGQVISNDDVAQDANWDIAFSRTSILLNNQKESPVSMFNIDNNAEFYDDQGAPISDMFLAATPESELQDYDAVSIAQVPAIENFVSDSSAQVIGDSFYNYDFTTHEISTNEETYYIVESDGNYTKFNVTELVPEGRGLGNITLNLAHQSLLDGQLNFATPTLLSIDAVGCVEDLFIDFDLQQVVTSTDAWDLKLVCSTGAAEFSLTLADETRVLKTDAQTYAGIDPAAVAFYGFTTDNTTSYAFAETPWYFYDSTTHLLHSQYSVYLLSTGDIQYKLQILSYYDEEATSGNYTFRYEALGEE